MAEALMRARRPTIKVVGISLLLSVLPLISGSQSASACAGAPNPPIVKTIWGTAGGPTFIVKASNTGEFPTTISYNYAIKKIDAKEWGPWIKWTPTSVVTLDSSATFVAPMSQENELITFSAYSYNNCGSSSQNQVYRKLVSFESLTITSLDIAQDIPLSVGKIKSDLFAPLSYYLPQTYISENPAICKFDETSSELQLLSEGLCEFTITQNNEILKTPNPDVTQSLNILPSPKILPEAMKDRPDEVSKFQIHVVYVKVKNVTPHNFDQSGDIANWLNLSNAWLKRKIGKEFIFDTFQGGYDISTLSTKYSEDDLEITYSSTGDRGLEISPLSMLREEFEAQNGSKLSGKNLLFIVDGNLSDDYCGLGEELGDTALTTPGGDQCWNPESGYLAQTSKFNFSSKSITHELIHNLGVGHPCEDKADLMIGEGCELSKSALEVTIDENRKLYVNSDAAGSNILDFKVWKDGSGSRYIPAPGICYLGEPCLVSDGVWNSIQADLEIQEKIAGKWRTIQKFKIKKLGARKYAYNASIRPIKRGIHTYREFIPETKRYLAYVGKPFTRNVVY
jgi:hypothetical protein